MTDRYIKRRYIYIYIYIQHYTVYTQPTTYIYNPNTFPSRWIFEECAMSMAHAATRLGCYQALDGERRDFQPPVAPQQVVREYSPVTSPLKIIVLTVIG